MKPHQPVFPCGLALAFFPLAARRRVIGNADGASDSCARGRHKGQHITPLYIAGSGLLATTAFCERALRHAYRGLVRNIR
jgi:hypothetical protein